MDDESLRVVTVPQPYATRLVTGAYTVMNRTYGTKYRGILLIHSSGRPAPGHTGLSVERYPRGQVLGSVDLFDVHEVSSGVDRPEGTLLARSCCRTALGALSVEQYHREQLPGAPAPPAHLWHYEVRSPAVLPEPIKWPSKSMLWLAPPELLARVNEQLRALATT